MNDRIERTFGVSLRDDDVAPALLFVALLAFALIVPAQSDTFYHLRSGQEMWQTQSLLTTERFSHTAYGAPLHNHWWLAQLVFFGLFSVGGPVLLTAFAGACAFAAVLGSWRLLRGPLEIRIGLLAFLVVATAPEWSVRPQVISLALLVAMAHLIARNRIEWLPLVCVVWANAHGMVVLGVVMAAACALESLVWTRERFARDALVALACIAAPMISPIGWNYWPQVLTTVSMSRGLELQEYRHPLEAADAPFWVAVAVLFGLAVRRRNDLRHHPREDRILLLAAAGLGIAAAMAVRNVAFFAVVAAPVLSRLWSWNPPEKARRAHEAGAGAYVFLVGATLIAGMTVSWRWSDGGASLGWRPISGEIVQAIRACPAPLFNHMGDGGYLMWAVPERRVFIDGRMEAYPLRVMQRSRLADIDGDYRALFEQYRIACAVVATGSRLHGRLTEDPSMHLLRSDGSRAVFTRRRGAREGSDRASVTRIGQVGR